MLSAGSDYGSLPLEIVLRFCVDFSIQRARKVMNASIAVHAALACEMF